MEMQKRYLKEAEQRQLLKAAKSCSDPLAQRDYHWMATLILTGMRIQEFSHLSAQQVRVALHCGWMVSRKEHCKGKRKANEYCVTAQLRTHLNALLAMSDQYAAGIGLTNEPDQPLIWGRALSPCAPVGPLSVRSYEVRLKVWAAAAGLDPRISPHWLRHTRGMNIMRRSRGDNPLKVAQIALNHSSLKSTGIYLQISREEYEREVQQIDGGRVPKRVAREMVEEVLA